MIYSVIREDLKISGPTENDDVEKIEELIKEEEKKSHSMHLICPVCNSRNVTYYIGGELGYQYRCKDCGYIGALVIEE